MTRYANILLDDAFKVIIFTPGNEELMARMIEVLLPGKRIRTLEPTEHPGLALSDKIRNFDAVCTSEDGEMFIVEMQGLPQASYADRMLCYASFPIRMQLEQKLKDLQSGRAKPMDYSLLPIYLVSIVNFRLPHDSDEILREGLISEYEICSPRTGERMTGALRFVFLELGRLVPKLGEEDKCNSIIEQLAYSVRYMKDLKECPKQFVDPLFPLLFGASEFARLDVNKQMQVTKIMRTELDRIAENNYARNEGFAQGKEQGIAEGKAETARETARALRELGVDVAIITKATGLSEEEVRGL